MNERVRASREKMKASERERARERTERELERELERERVRELVTRFYNIIVHWLVA